VQILPVESVNRLLGNKQHCVSGNPGDAGATFAFKIGSTSQKVTFRTAKQHLTANAGTSFDNFSTAEMPTETLQKGTEADSIVVFLRWSGMTRSTKPGDGPYGRFGDRIRYAIRRGLPQIVPRDHDEMRPTPSREPSSCRLFSGHSIRLRGVTAIGTVRTSPAC
jgi:hypothetical protein